MGAYLPYSSNIVYPSLQLNLCQSAHEVGLVGKVMFVNLRHWNEFSSANHMLPQQEYSCS